MLCCCLLLSSCGAAAEGNSGRAEKRPSDPFKKFVSAQNGLYYHPFLLNEPAGAEAQSYALTVLAETGPEPKVSLDAKGQSALRGDALAMSPLWGRYWLIPFRRADATGVLGPRDAEAVRKLRRKDGSYRDPDQDAKDTAALIGSTWAALEVLDAIGSLGEADPAETGPTAAWLTSRAEGTHDLSEAGALARSLRLLSRPVPERLTRLEAPRMAGFTSLKPGERIARLVDTYGYVQIQEAAGHRPEIDVPAWRQVLRHNADTLDYEQLFYAVHILRAAGADEGAYTDVRRRLERNRLDDGTVRDPDTYAGSLDASLWVERLRTLAGLPTEDRRLVTALDRAAVTADHSPDSGELLARAALYRQAGTSDGAQPTTNAANAECRAGRLLPGTVTADNASPWQRQSMACTEAGSTVPAPAVDRWQLDSPQQVAAAAALVVGLYATGHRDAVPAWITADALASWARNPERFTSVFDYAQTVRAHLLLGGEAKGALRAAMRRGTGPYKGCPGLPDLYRTGGDDPGCDLKTTWAVRALDQQAHGVLNALPDDAARTAARKDDVMDEDGNNE